MIRIALGILLGSWLVIGTMSLASKIAERREVKKISKAKIKNYAKKYVEEHNIED